MCRADETPDNPQHQQAGNGVAGGYVRLSGVLSGGVSEDEQRCRDQWNIRTNGSQTLIVSGLVVFLIAMVVIVMMGRTLVLGKDMAAGRDACRRGIGRVWGVHRAE